MVILYGYINGLGFRNVDLAELVGSVELLKMLQITRNKM